jgi:hypothetical protein
MPKGRLLSYYHNITNPEIPYSFRLELTCDEDGKGKLRVGNDQPVMVDGEVIDSWVAFFKEKKLQAIDKKYVKKPKDLPIFSPHMESIIFMFERGKVESDGFMPTIEMRNLLEEFDSLLTEYFKQHSQTVPAAF